MNEETLSLVKKIAKRTIGYDIGPMKREEMGENIEKFINECLKNTGSDKSVRIKGNGLDEDIVMEVSNN